MFLLLLLVTLGNFAIGFGLAMHFGWGPKWRLQAMMRLAPQRKPDASAH